MFESVNRYREKITIPNKGYGVLIVPEPVYRYPKEHPCHGCVFTFQISKPSCLTGGYPDTENCINSFYKKMQSRQPLEHGKRPDDANRENN